MRSRWPRSAPAGSRCEYLFDFDGGRPPWASGLAQGTGIQALSRAAIRLNEPRYFEAARAALGIFRDGPAERACGSRPSAARTTSSTRSRPDMRVLNAFTQALNGLHDFALLANDAEGHALFAAGEARAAQRAARLRHRRVVALLAAHRGRPQLPQARARLPRNLCGRLKDDAARAATGAAAGAGAAQTGGALPIQRRRAGRAGPRCRRRTATRRSASRATCSQPPVVKVVTRRVRAGKPAALRLTLSKPSYVKLAVVGGGRTFVVLASRGWAAACARCAGRSRRPERATRSRCAPRTSPATSAARGASSTVLKKRR